MVPVPGHWDHGGETGGLGRGRSPVALGQERFVTEAGVPLPTLRIEDPERRPPAGWTGAIARDDHLRSLSDDVTPQANPGATAELEPDPGRLADSDRERLRQAGRLQEHETDGGTSRERGQAAETVTDPGRRRDPRRQVHHDEVNGTTREERACDRKALLQVGGRHDHEPLRPDPAGDRLHGVEGCGEIEPCDDRPGGLRLGGQPQGQGRASAGEIATEREPHPARETTGPEDPVQLGEARREDPGEVGGSWLAGQPVPWEGNGRERADNVTHPPWRGRAPLRPEGREGRGDVRGECCHRPSIEQMFE
jgi:hypothetical protein